VYKLNSIDVPDQEHYPIRNQIINGASVGDDEPHRSESQPPKSLDVATQVFDGVVVDQNPVGLQEPVQPAAGTKTRQLPQFRLVDVTSLVFLEPKRLQRPAPRTQRPHPTRDLSRISLSRRIILRHEIVYWNLASIMIRPREEARRILDSLPDGASWEDIQYSIYVRERLERGRREADDEKLIDQDEIEVRMERWLNA